MTFFFVPYRQPIVCIILCDEFCRSVRDVFHEVEFVCDLSYPTLRRCNGRTVVSRSVTADNMYIFMLLHPLTEALRLPVAKQVYRPSVCIVNDDASVGEPFAPGPIVNANLFDIIISWRPHPVQVAQDRRGTDEYAYMSKQAAGRA